MNPHARILCSQSNLKIFIESVPAFWDFWLILVKQSKNLMSHDNVCYCHLFTCYSVSIVTPKFIIIECQWCRAWEFLFSMQYTPRCFRSFERWDFIYDECNVNRGLLHFSEKRGCLMGITLYPLLNIHWTNNSFLVCETKNKFSDWCRQSDKLNLPHDISLEVLTNMSLNEKFTRKGFIHPFSFIYDF